MNIRTVVVLNPHGGLTTKRLPVTPDGWAALHPSGQAKAKKLAQMAERLIAYRASQAAGAQAQKAAC